MWRHAAENVAESLQRGMRVIVTGRLKSRSYQTREGEKRTVFEIDVDEVGPALKYATATVTRTDRAKSTQTTWGSAPTPTPPAAGADPWAQQAMTDTPPF